MPAGRQLKGMEISFKSDQKLTGNSGSCSGESPVQYTMAAHSRGFAASAASGERRGSSSATGSIRMMPDQEQLKFLQMSRMFESFSGAGPSHADPLFDPDSRCVRFLHFP